MSAFQLRERLDVLLLDAQYRLLAAEEHHPAVLALEIVDILECSLTTCSSSP
jgi:hypothetical protein